MRNTLLKWAAMLLAVVMVLPLLAPNAQTADKKEKAESGPPLKLKVGDTAPNFTLLAFDGHDLKKISLSQYRGKKDVVLAFYVFAFTGG